MTALSRKQREIRDRERLILDVARRMFLDDGYFATTMDKIARATEYSKGTIYQHFGSKEAVLAALSLDTMRRGRDFFERGAAFSGRPRERMCAIGIAYEFFFRLHTEDLVLAMSIKSSELKSKLPEERRRQLDSSDDEIHEIITGVVRDAIAAGDLALPEGLPPAQVSFALWSMSFGAYTILRTCDAHLLERRGIADPFAQTRQNCHRVMDGFAWQPLTMDWDYERTDKRIRDEVFSEETARLAN